MKGLVLSGGGARGLYQTGFLLALKEYGIEFDLVSGASAGALNGAAWISNELEGLFKTFYELFKENRYNFNPFNLKEPFPHSRIVREALKRYQSVEPVKTSNIKLRIVVRTEKGEHRVYDNNCDLHRVLLASCSVPIIFIEPVIIDGNRCYDGALVNWIPIEPALKEGCNKLIMVLTASEKRATLPSCIRKAIIKVGSLGGNQFKQFMEGVGRRYDPEAHKVPLLPSNIKYMVFRPLHNLPIANLDLTSHIKAKETFQIGYRDGLKSSKLIKRFLEEG